MRGAEARFYKLIKDHLPGDFSRVENVVDSGMPDISGAWQGVDYWVELKAFDEDKSLNAVSLLRPVQIVWQMKRSKEGSRIFTLVKIKDKIFLLRMRNKVFGFVWNWRAIGNRWIWSDFEEVLKKKILEA